MLLKVTDLEVAYGPAPALWGVTLGVRQGELLSVVGPNSAGKSTLINTLAGLLRARAGTIELEGRDITQLPAHRFCGAGIALVPEGRRLFATMSVLENLELGSFTRARERRASNLEKVFGIFPRLRERIRQNAGTMSGGEQQMLAIGRGLMAEPVLLILDEPSLGLSPLLVEELFSLIKSINRQGIALLLVEQNVVQSLEVASRAYVLDNGAIVLQGSAADVRNDPNLKRAYLGM